MRKRLTLAAVTVFWLVMMTLLWRSESGFGKPMGAKIPPQLVWHKILTAPDPSTLEIRHGTNRIGYCRWRADVGQELATGAVMFDEADPVEGMVRNLTSYTLDVDGNIAVPDVAQRARFVFNLTFDTNRVWKHFMLRVTLRPDIYEISANSTQKVLRVFVDAGADKFTREIPFADLQDPRKILLEFGGPALPLMFGIMGPPPATDTNAVATLPIKWEAQNDALMLGGNSIRAYRLKATLLDRYRATFYVSPVGEILRVELPQRVHLINDVISGLRRTND
ncbi:MAG TPA: hypothetical protein VK530_07325 [Candidatus Acidoferrum sp.]|nr:hypothetical protein [Candidatus Acidoferrum sp.]